MNKTYQKKALPWIICAMGALFYSYEYLLRIIPNVMTAHLMNYYDIAAPMLGFVMAFYYYIYTPMQIPVGVMMDRHGPRRLLTLASLMCVLGSFLYVLTPYVAVVALGRLLVGFGSAFAFVGVLKLATIWLPPSRMAMVSGMASALGTFGGMVAEKSLPPLMHAYGWRHAVFIVSAVGLVVTVLVWLVIRDENPHAELVAVNEKADYGQLKKDVSSIVKNRQIWINGAISCLIYLPTTAFAELWGVPYLEQARGFSVSLATTAITALFFGFGIGAPLSGYLSDKMGRRRMPLFVGTVGAGILFSLMLYVPSIPNVWIVPLLFVMGMFYSAHVIAFAIGREISPTEAAGSAIAVTNMIVMLGGFLFQPLVGILLGLHATGAGHLYTLMDYQFALSVIPLGIMVAAVLVYFLKETHGMQIYNAEYPDLKRRWRAQQPKQVLSVDAL